MLAACPCVSKSSHQVHWNTIWSANINSTPKASKPLYFLNHRHKKRRLRASSFAIWWSRGEHNLTQPLSFHPQSACPHAFRCYRQCHTLVSGLMVEGAEYRRCSPWTTRSLEINAWRGTEPASSDREMPIRLAGLMPLRPRHRQAARCCKS